jgi:16S rRNA (cytosine1402-N4)-methyltransferase
MSTELSGASPRHISVLPVEVLALLEPAPGQVFVDATVGAGGHARMLAERLAPGGRLIGLDRDAAMLDLARPRLAGLPVTLVQAPFSRLREVLDEMGIAAVDGVLADVGFCSDQIDDPQRGLSFTQPGPLDMRLDPTQGEPASALLQRLNERDLADLIYRYGEERFSRRIARRIVEVRRSNHMETTEELAELVRRCVPRPPRSANRRRPPIDPATRVFQALRIAVNDELGELGRGLVGAERVLMPGGRLAVVAFHSLEDSRVKSFLRQRSGAAGGSRHAPPKLATALPSFRLLGRRAIRPDAAEIARNPRARSARLRAAERTAAPPWPLVPAAVAEAAP